MIINWVDFKNVQSVFSFHSVKILLSEFIITTKTLTKSSILIKYKTKWYSFHFVVLLLTFSFSLFSVRCRSRQSKHEWKAWISSRIHSQKGSFEFFCVCSLARLKFLYVENQKIQNYRRMVLRRSLHKLGWMWWTHSKRMILFGSNTIDFGEENILTWNRVQDRVRKRWFVKSSALNRNNFLNVIPINYQLLNKQPTNSHKHTQDGLYKIKKDKLTNNNQKTSQFLLWHTQIMCNWVCELVHFVLICYHSLVHCEEAFVKLFTISNSSSLRFDLVNGVFWMLLTRVWSSFIFSLRSWLNNALNSVSLESICTPRQNCDKWIKRKPKF